MTVQESETKPSGYNGWRFRTPVMAISLLLNRPKLPNQAMTNTNADPSRRSHDITEPTSSTPLRPTEAARLELARTALESGTTLSEIIRRSCELSAQTLNVARVGVWMFVDDRSSMRCINLYEHPSGERSEGAVLRVADLPSYFDTLQNRKIVSAEVAVGDPKTSELMESYLLPLGITSLLDAPIFVGGEVIGVLCNEHVGPPREWTTEERDFAASIADLLALKIRSAEVHQLRETLRENEKRMVSLERMDSLAKMAVGIAHDFRNLLTVVIGNAHVLRSSPDLPVELQPMIKEITDAAERGSNLVSELVEFGRNQPAKPIPFSPAQQVIEFLPMLQSTVGEKYRIDVQHAAPHGKVFMDKHQLDRVLLNLVVNAREAMPAGGTIRIRTTQELVEEYGGLPYLAVEVADEGDGMDFETQKRVFEPFFSTKKHGSGLGMAIVQRIVERSGGFIRIESQPQSGTKVRIFLPRVARS